MKRSLAFITLAALAVAISFAAPYKAELKIASSTSLSHTYNVGAQYFAKLVTERSGGSGGGYGGCAIAAAVSLDGQVIHFEGQSSTLAAECQAALTAEGGARKRSLHKCALAEGNPASRRVGIGLRRYRFDRCPTRLTRENNWLV